MPDPLQLVYEFDEPADREVAGLIASSFALGRVKSILTAASAVLGALHFPAKVLRDSSAGKIRQLLSDISYRFFSSDDIVALMTGIGGILRRYGSLGECFRDLVDHADQTTIPALLRFVQTLEAVAGTPLKMLSDPAKGSACKRLHLYLRWMIRRDRVDPGVWDGISPSTLIVPMDVHMHSISKELGFTSRRQADAKTALEVTEQFRLIRPDDPVRYDFCLTRMGIHPAVPWTKFEAE